MEPSCNGWATIMKNIIDKPNPNDYQLVAINQVNNNNLTFTQYVVNYIRETYQLFLYFVSSITT